MGSHAPPHSPKTLGQGMFSDGGPHSITPLLLPHPPHYSRPFSSGEVEAQGKEVASARTQDKAMTSATASLERVRTSWDS